MKEKFVSVVGTNGGPGVLYGPFDEPTALKVMFTLLESEQTENGPVEVDDEIRDVVEEIGYYEFDGGGGIYMIEASSFELPAKDDDEDEDE